MGGYVRDVRVAMLECSMGGHVSGALVPEYREGLLAPICAWLVWLVWIES